MEEDRESKKLKLSEENNEVSKVIHIRGLPLDCTEYELKMIIPYPHQPEQLLFLKGKGQAFIQLKDLTSAAQFIEYCRTNPPRVRNKPVYLQYSKRQELEVQPQNNLAATPNPVSGCIIHVSIYDCYYPVNVEILCSVFQYHGQILKIVIFTKKDQPNVVNALIQYSDPMAANSAKTTMNMKHLYEGSGILKIQDSNLKDLTIEYNNEKSWDFTTQLPPGPPNKQSIGGKSGVGGVSAGFGGFGVGSQSMPHIPGLPSMHGAFNSGFGAGSSAAGMGALGGVGGSSNFNNPLFHPGATADFSMSGQSPVVLVSNLNDQKVTPDILFALFSCYGDVQKVKILFNKRDNALIQFSNAQQASTAQKLLNGTALFGKTLQIALSNKMSVTGSQQGSEDGANFNKDYTNSEFHRFKVAGSKNFQNICPPSATLHISNIPKPDANLLKEIFSQYGTVVNFKFFPNNEKMALIQMSSTAEAVEALVNTHLYPMSESSKIRVSFSKSSI